MNKYSIYNYQHVEKGLSKILIENDWNTLYLWIYSEHTLQKIQFDYRGEVAIEVSASTSIVRRISNDSNFNLKNIATIFNRTFAEKVKVSPEMIEEIKSVEFPLKTDLKPIRDILIHQKWVTNLKVLL